MGSRERKREELRKRKERAAERAAEQAPVGASPETGAPDPDEVVPGTRFPTRSELKDQQAREALVPLAEGERPLVVTIGAILSGLLALSIVVAFVLGTEVNGEKAEPVQVIVPTALMGVMAWGMWRARYWAVLGFQTVLVILILISSLSLVGAGTAVQAIGNAVLLAICGTLFYFMVKALARIQMPDRRPSG